MANENITQTSAGTHIAAEPLTTSLSREYAPGLLRSDVDSRIVRIRPSATPLDQISRMAGARAAKSMVVDYYSIDTKAGSDHTLKAVRETPPSLDALILVEVENPGLFAPSETVMFPDIHVDGPQLKNPLVGYIDQIDGSTLQLVIINVDPQQSIPPIPQGSLIVRMGRAACELDVQTPQFAALPKKAQNFCQIFKAQVEQSTLQRIADKEVGWTFSDQEEVAIIDMRLGMEKSFLFGAKARTNAPSKGDEEVFLTQGIWAQAGRSFECRLDALTPDTLVDLMKLAFTGNAGSTRKVLIAGSDLIAALNKMDLTRVVTSSAKETVWGVDFHTLCSKFGTLYVIHSEVFDHCGRPTDGMVIDPEYITKYCHIPFSTERLSLRQSGVRNTDAVVLTEASCLVLRYPEAHIRILGTKD